MAWPDRLLLMGSGPRWQELGPEAPQRAQTSLSYKKDSKRTTKGKLIGGTAALPTVSPHKQKPGRPCFPASGLWPYTAALLPSLGFHSLGSVTSQGCSKGHRLMAATYAVPWLQVGPRGTTGVERGGDSESKHDIPVPLKLGSGQRKGWRWSGCSLRSPRLAVVAILSTCLHQCPHGEMAT